jgi:hypothetical protein
MVAGAFASVELTSSPASAQGAEEITGVGTPTFIPQFIGRHTLANSNIFQTGSRIGVNTTNPATTLDVESNDFAAIKGATSSNAQFATGVFGQTASANAGIGVDGENFATNGVNHGVLGRSFSTSGIGVGGIAAATTGNAYGVFGSTDTTGSGAGVFGSGNATDGTASGVAGQANSPAGNAILGVFAPSTGGGGGGVNGVTNSADFGFSYGVKGTAQAHTGSALGVFGEVFSADGAAGYFLNRGGGNIIVGHTGAGDTLSVFRVDSTGRVFADGGFQPNGADFAESIAVKGERIKYSPGDLLVIDPTATRRLALAQRPYSTLVAGIYSTKPGVLGATRGVDESAPKDEIPLAVVGIVPCKVTAENGPIAAGDLLVTSSTPGHAMKGTDRSRMLGAVVGKALEPLQKGTGAIQVLVTLQ